MTSRLRIRHETTYFYDRPVAFTPWRLMMRPADSHALRVVDASLEFTPAGATRWSHDAYGNSVCVFEPGGESNVLTVVNHLVIDRFPNPLPAPSWDDPLSTLPILYSDNDRIALDPFIRPADRDAADTVALWLRQAPLPSGGLALDWLKALNALIPNSFRYAARDAEGTQTPAETLARGSGTCRDFAWLMIEAARRMGFAARFVTGYIYSGGNVGAGATHAWCEVFLPWLGWIEFDPTNALTESRDLIRIAAVRTPEEASPMIGGIFGNATAQMNVRVDVERVQAQGVGFSF